MKSSRFWLAGLGVLALVALLALANGARAGEAYCDACKGDSGWSGAAKLDEIGNPNAHNHEEVMPGLNTAQKNRVGIWKKPAAGFEDDPNQAANVNNVTNTTPIAVKAASSESKPVVADAPAVRSEQSRKMLLPIGEVSGTDILLDISENATEHIPGSIAIPYTEFLRNSSLKSVPEITEILGDAGISEKDPLVVYGECMPCGGGPAPADYVYLMLKSLGQENVRVLDGTVEDWAAAGKSTAKETTIKPPQKYTPQFTPDLMATYDYVKSGSAQILDARAMEAFGTGSIPGAINVPYESVLDDKKIKDEAKLERVFATLSKNRPVVVYTETGVKASVVWFALELMGYDARLYSYENWLVNQAAAENKTA